MSDCNEHNSSAKLGKASSQSVKLPFAFYFAGEELTVEIFIRKCLTVDGFAACSISSGKITAWAAGGSTHLFAAVTTSWASRVDGGIQGSSAMQVCADPES